MGIKTKCYTLTEKMFPVCPVLMQHFVRHCSGSQTMALRSSDPETRRLEEKMIQILSIISVTFQARII